uniref:Uncharacterized protein n=1 Tax=Lepeophtheirus salmonis TaxID=72036 RepID=A0A0K2V8C2_LEPSM
MSLCIVSKRPEEYKAVFLCFCCRCTFLFCQPLRSNNHNLISKGRFGQKKTRLYNVDRRLPKKVLKNVMI